MRYSWDAELFGWAVLIIIIWFMFGDEIRTEYLGYAEYKQAQDICQNK